jgi:hypothetical protein
VRLCSSDGASITLRPAAYQFEVPPATAGERDWDANWLMIRGDVRTADGRGWAFLDPCLTTWEARNLSAWLRGAVGEGAARRRLIAFTEPNMAFSIEHRRAGRVRLEVRFSHEALPPWCHATMPAGRRVNTSSSSTSAGMISPLPLKCGTVNMSNSLNADLRSPRRAAAQSVADEGV